MPRRKKVGNILLPPYPGLEIKQSSIPGAGNGVFATETLSAGTMIPIIGFQMTTKGMNKLIQSDKATHAYEYSDRISVDARPELDKANIAIWSRINEASGRKKPNCIMNVNFVVVGKTIKAGEELFLYYGNEYKRSGYTVKDFSDMYFERLASDRFRYPSLEERKKVIKQLNEQFKRALQVEIE